MFEDFNFCPFAQCIHALHTNAVQTAAHFVSVVAELSACVDLGEDDFDSGATIDCRIVVTHRVNWHTATVIDHCARAINTHPHSDGSRVARHHFVDRVVHALVDKMVQRAEPSAADIHARSLANRFKTFKNLDGIGGVVVRVGDVGGVHDCVIGGDRAHACIIARKCRQ